MNDTTVVEKKCSKCGETKPTTEFWKSGRKHGDGYETRCKECRKSQRYERIARDPELHRQKVNANQRRFYINNPSAVKAASKRYQLKNPDKIQSISKEWRKNNPEKVKARKRKWRKLNPEKVNASERSRQKKPHIRVRNAARMRSKRANDPHFRILCCLRTRICNALNGTSKSATTVKLLGCPIDSFKIYLESLFEVGMSWKNYGRGDDRWNIEHEIPCALFDLTNPSHQEVCFHFSNMRPMWQPKNLKKSDNVTPEILEKFHARISEQSV